MTLLKRLRYVDISKYMKQIEFGKFFFLQERTSQYNTSTISYLTGSGGSNRGRAMEMQTKHYVPFFLEQVMSQCQPQKVKIVIP